MKKLSQLKSWIDLFLYTSIVGLIFLIIIIPASMYDPEIMTPVKINGEIVDYNETSARILVIFSTIGAAIFTYGIWQLRKALNLFTKRAVFHPDVSCYFHKTGQCIIAATLITTVGLIPYKIVHGYKNEITLHSGILDTFVLPISLGLLFIVISEVFKMAGKIKEENDLTV